jgi:hypothetical protein
MLGWLKAVICACVAVLVTAAAGNAQSVYQVKVDLDESTVADGELLTAAAVTATSGDASQSIRKLAAGFVGEVQILLNRRVDRYGMLTLDDMSVVALTDEDAIEVKKSDCKDCGGGSGRSVSVIVLHKTGRPSGIRFYFPDGCRELSFVDQGKPRFMDMACPAIPR